MSIIGQLPVDGSQRRFVGPGGYLPAGELIAGTDYGIAYVRVVNTLARVVSTPTLTVAGAYATGDYIGPSAAPASFVGLARDPNGALKVVSLVITDKQTAAAVAMELWLFNATITVPTDNAAWAITDADQLHCQGVIPIAATDWYANANGKVYSNDRLNLIVQPDAQAVFYALVARGATPTWASGDLQLSLGVVAD